MMAREDGQFLNDNRFALQVIAENRMSGFAGRWNHEKSVDVLEYVVREWLRRGGFDEGTIERWHESGYIETTASSRGRTVRTRIAGQTASVYRIPMSMFERYA